MGSARILRRAGLAIAGGSAMLVPAAVALAASGTFTGTTSQGQACGPNFKSACQLRVTVANGSVQKLSTRDSYILWAAPCQSGKNEILANETDFWGKLTRHTLRLKNQRYTQNGIPGKGGPYSADNTLNLIVHVGHMVTGSLSVSSVVYKGTKVVNHCQTGTVDFTAYR